jgi:hypothetical protein
MVAPQLLVIMEETVARKPAADSEGGAEFAAALKGMPAVATAIARWTIARWNGGRSGNHSFASGTA